MRSASLSRHQNLLFDGFDVNMSVATAHEIPLAHVCKTAVWKSSIPVRTGICCAMVTAGQKCQQLLDAKLRGLRPNLVQADELHSFVGAREKHLRFGAPQEFKCNCELSSMR